ncbi:MAG TPA: tetratricopeptide repeat protein, partial [Gallionella sp.]|nr:tetratricopeptide repeat protein [Gallionella sp.]
MIVPEEVLRHATTFYEAGRLDEAEELCLGVLLTEPEHAAANHYLGLIALQRGLAERALPYLQMAWEVDPSAGAHWLTLAECLLALGRFEDALNLVKEASKRGLDAPQVQQLRLLAKRGLDRTAPSAAVVDEMLALFRAGRNAELESRVSPLLEQYPGWVFGWRALGAAMGMLGRDAEPVLRRAMALAPQDASTHNNLGVVLRERGRQAESLICLRKAVQLSPKYAEAHYNLGTVLQDMSRYDEAIVCFRQAIRIKPDYFEAQAELSNSLSALGRFAEALKILERLPRSRPDHPKALSNLLFNLTHRGDIDADTLFAEHCRFGAQFDAPLQAFANARDHERRLRVGIVSGDLHLHAVANFIEPVLLHLRHSAQLSLHAYYNHVQEDEVTQRLKGYFAQWDSVFGLTDEELAQKIRADGIDILIDLSGHTARNRLPLFARKPAPIQAS